MRVGGTRVGIKVGVGLSRVGSGVDVLISCANAVGAVVATAIARVALGALVLLNNVRNETPITALTAHSATTTMAPTIPVMANGEKFCVCCAGATGIVYAACGIT